MVWYQAHLPLEKEINENDKKVKNLALIYVRHKIRNHMCGRRTRQKERERERTISNLLYINVKMCVRVRV